MKLAWSAIVRNERAILERCVRSLLPTIDCAIVVDTGSTDETPEFLQQMFDLAGKPLELHRTDFVNFEYARNTALRMARTSTLDWDYLLLADADMELVVQRPLQLNGGMSYDMLQKAGSITYANRRLVSRQATGEFVGVTHEFLDIPSSGLLDGAYFLDHADGSNRPGKFVRDIALLEEALKTETRPGLIERYEFYLGQSYFDKGNWLMAAEHYKKRMELGGFDEERWNARLHYAHCLDNLGDRPGFLWQMLQAYAMRPQRAEVLYDLAKYFRERGENHTSLLFSEMGMQVPYPKNDLLFVNDFVYKSGLAEEFSICAYYDSARRERGAVVCNELALHGSQQARNNLFWYLKPLAEHVSSFKPRWIEFEAPDGHVAMNPSVINYWNAPLVLLRTVNYTITPEGCYAVRGEDGVCNTSNPICTRNFLVHVAFPALTVGMAREILPPQNLQVPDFDLVRGFEDSRLFEWKGDLWTISTVRELNPEGWCEQVLAPLVVRGYGDDWKKILPKDRQHQKNWVPFIDSGGLRFVYRPGTLIDANGELTVQSDCGLDVGHISGGSQVVEADGNHLAIVHEAGTIPGRVNRYYQHRFIRYDVNGRVLGLSPPFVFFDKQIEFCAGMAYFPARRQLLLSFGVRDAEAWLASVDLYEVLVFIEDLP